PRIIRTTRTVRRKRSVDHIRPARADGSLIESQRDSFSTAKVVQKDVASGSQAEYGFAPRRFRDVDSDRPFAAVERCEIAAERAAMGPHGAPIFAAPWTLHFNHIRAQIGKNHA